MRKMNSAEFRQWFTKLDEPVEVTKYNDKHLGTWLPSSTKLPAAEPPVGVTEAPIANVELPKRVTETEGDFAAFHPVPKPMRKKRDA